MTLAPAARRALAVVATVVAVVAAVLLVLGAAGAPASAHAVLVGSTPADGSSVRVAPADVRLQFDENVQLVSGTARVISDDGRYVDTGAARGSGPSVVIPLQAHVPRGQYTATWRVVSADGHVVSGSIAFGVGEPAGHVDATAPGGSRAVELGYDTGTGLGTSLLVLVIGVPVGLRLLRVRRPGDPLTGSVRLLVLGGADLAVLAAVLAVLADQARASSRSPWRAVASIGDWRLTSHTEQMLVLRLVCLLVLVVSLRRPGRRADVVGVAAGAGLVVSHAWFGHASVGSWAWVAVPSTALHLVAMAVWLGGLLALLLVLVGQVTCPVDEVATGLRRWSRTAATCVGVLVATGVVQSLRQVQPVASLWDTPYGLLLLGKVALVGVVLLVAAFSRRTLADLTGSGRAPVERARRRLLGGVGVELGCLVGVLAVTSVLVVEPPAREVYGPGITLQAPLGTDRLSVRVAGTRRGHQTITVTRESATGRVLPLQTLSGRLSLPDGGVAAITVVFRREGDGAWRSTDAVAPLPGTWQLDLDAGIDQATAYATLVRYRVW